MKSYLPHASILMVLILLAMPGFSGTARVHRAQQTPTQQVEPQLPELASPLKLSAEALRVKAPPECQNTTLDVQTHGDKDGYVIAPSPALAIYRKDKAGHVKGYDDGQIERIFADSFELKNCRICYATLEFGVKHSIGNWLNDTFVGGVAPFDKSTLYFFRPDNKDAFIWDVRLPNPKTMTLETTPATLAALNTYLATSPIPTYLDVRGEDDTEFDYVTLRVWYY
jgi:hypothetical protein